jgi:hypothetical protein
MGLLPTTTAATRVTFLVLSHNILDCDNYVFIEYDDECVTASEIYSCGRDREPGIVDAIFNSEKGNATVVSKLKIVCSCLSMGNIFNFHTVRPSDSVHANISRFVLFHQTYTALRTQRN